MAKMHSGFEKISIHINNPNYVVVRMYEGGYVPISGKFLDVNKALQRCDKIKEENATRSMIPPEEIKVIKIKCSIEEVK